MKNNLIDLQNHIFGLMEKLNNDNLTGDALDIEIKRSEAFSSLATIAVKNATLIAQCAGFYGFPAEGDLPLLPASPGALIPKEADSIGKKKPLLKNREYDE